MAILTYSVNSIGPVSYTHLDVYKRQALTAAKVHHIWMQMSTERDRLRVVARD